MAKRRSKFRLIASTCRRCGQPVTTGSHALQGSDATKAKWDRICGNCMTVEEREQMYREIRDDVIDLLERN
jgi:hypothetical protein